MIKKINIAKRQEALSELNCFKENLYHYDVELSNLHLKELNNVYHKEFFKHNDAFISSEVLYKILNNIQSKDINYHGLTVEMLYSIFRCLRYSDNFFESGRNRFVIVTQIRVKSGDPVIVILEINAPLRNLRKLKINKIVTVYPKRNFNSFLKNHEKKM